MKTKNYWGTYVTKNGTVKEITQQEYKAQLKKDPEFGKDFEATDKEADEYDTPIHEPGKGQFKEYETVETQKTVELHELTVKPKVEEYLSQRTNSVWNKK